MLTCSNLTETYNPECDGLLITEFSSMSLQSGFQAIVLFHLVIQLFFHGRHYMWSVMSTATLTLIHSVVLSLDLAQAPRGSANLHIICFNTNKMLILCLL